MIVAMPTASCFTGAHLWCVPYRSIALHAGLCINGYLSEGNLVSVRGEGNLVSVRGEGNLVSEG